MKAEIGFIVRARLYPRPGERNQRCKRRSTMGTPSRILPGPAELRSAGADGRDAGGRAIVDVLKIDLDHRVGFRRELIEEHVFPAAYQTSGNQIQTERPPAAHLSSPCGQGQGILSNLSRVTFAIVATTGVRQIDVDDQSLKARRTPRFRRDSPILRV